VEPDAEDAAAETTCSSSSTMALALVVVAEFGAADKFLLRAAALLANEGDDEGLLRTRAPEKRNRRRSIERRFETNFEMAERRKVVAPVRMNISFRDKSSKTYEAPAQVGGRGGSDGRCEATKMSSWSSRSSRRRLFLRPDA